MTSDPFQDTGMKHHTRNRHWQGGTRVRVAVCVCVIRFKHYILTVLGRLRIRSSITSGIWERKEWRKGRQGYTFRKVKVMLPIKYLKTLHANEDTIFLHTYIHIYSGG